MNHIPECLDGPRGCRGKIEYRMPLSGTGRSFPRCEHHWEERLDAQQAINDRYPVMPPRDFDPMYAGESWDDADAMEHGAGGGDPDEGWY